MSEAQNSLPSSDAELVSPDYAAGLVAGADGERCGDFRTDDRPDLGGHTLLCRPPAPQGRRSLFRR